MEVKNQPVLRFVFLVCSGISLMCFIIVYGLLVAEDEMYSSLAAQERGQTLIFAFAGGIVFGFLAFRAVKQLINKHRVQRINQEDASIQAAVQKDVDYDGQPIEQGNPTEHNEKSTDVYELSTSQQEANVAIHEDLVVNDKPIEQKEKSFKIFKPTTKQYLGQGLGSLVLMLIFGYIYLQTLNGDLGTGIFGLLIILPLLIVSSLSCFFSFIAAFLKSKRNH